MPINITWVDNCDGEEKIERLHTSVCTLKVHRRQDVITNIEWDFSEDADATGNNDKQYLDFWPEPKETVNVKLLKQGSDHQNKVWAELLKIPLGETLTYSALAKKIGSAARAVGNACRTNPYTLLIPCHRVVAMNGIGGYSGHRHGEYMLIKEKLLAYEANLFNGNEANSVHTLKGTSGSTTEGSVCGASSPRTELAI